MVLERRPRRERGSRLATSTGSWRPARGSCDRELLLTTMKTWGGQDGSRRGEGRRTTRCSCAEARPRPAHVRARRASSLHTGGTDAAFSTTARRASSLRRWRNRWERRRAGEAAGERSWQALAREVVLACLTACSHVAVSGGRGGPKPIIRQRPSSLWTRVPRNHGATPEPCMGLRPHVTAMHRGRAREGQACPREVLGRLVEARLASGVESTNAGRNERRLALERDGVAGNGR